MNDIIRLRQRLLSLSAVAALAALVLTGCGGGKATTTPEYAAAVDAWHAQRVERLRSDTGVPHSLAELGVDDGKTALIAQMAVVDPSAGGNPLPLSEASVSQLFSDALHGRL